MTHWLDILPAIPLALYVPFDFEGSRYVVVGLDEHTVYLSGMSYVVGPRVRRVEITRPDFEETAKCAIDTAVGFAYALRYLFQQETDEHRAANVWWLAPSSEWATNHWAGHTIDLDRLCLARALAEVTR